MFELSVVLECLARNRVRFNVRVSLFFKKKLFRFFLIHWHDKGLMKKPEFI